MGEQDQVNDTSAVATLPTGPVLDEVIRLARVVDQHAPTGYASHVLRIVRDTVAPGLTSALWAEWVGHGSRLAGEAERLEEQQRRQEQINRRTPEIEALFRAVPQPTAHTWNGIVPLRDLFRSRGYRIEEYADSNARYVATWEAQQRVDALVAPALDALRAAATGPIVVPAAPGVESEDEEPGCPHTNGVRCEECDGTGCDSFDGWGDPTGCSTGCPDCELCEAEHNCQDCGLNPDCTHAWQCRDCDGAVEWSRAERGWVTVPD